MTVFRQRRFHLFHQMSTQPGVHPSHSKMAQNDWQPFYGNFRLKTFQVFMAHFEVDRFSFFIFFVGTEMLPDKPPACGHIFQVFRARPESYVLS